MLKPSTDVAKADSLWVQHVKDLYPLSTGLQQDALHFPLHNTTCWEGPCPVATPGA